MSQDDNTKVQRGIQDINQAFKEREVESRAKTLGLPYVNLLTTPLNTDLNKILPREASEHAQAALFFKSGKQLRLAVVDPQADFTRALVDELTRKGYQVSLALASEESVQSAQRIYFKDRYQPQVEVAEEKGSVTAEEEIANLGELKAKIENSRFDVALHIVEVGGYRATATDIHFQPQVESVVVRFRIDGVLHPVFSLNREIYEGILKELKQRSHLKLNVTTVPQDGQYTFDSNGRQINVRVSLLPTRYGEACVMRLMDPEKAFVDFKELGFSGEALRNLEEGIKLPHGLILVTGPTGAGKTTTLYALLKAMDTQAKKVITLEDPVEYNLPGVTQSQVSPEVGYTFSNGLRAILRQDPNVIMVGEIRDQETAEIAAQASLTGHLVISTLHTNAAIESIPRLINMGVKGFILAPALDLIIAQRLVRRLCSCAVDRPVTAVEQEHIQVTLDQIKAKGLETPVLPPNLRRAVGCNACGKTGYRGQLAIAEVLRFNQELRDLLLEAKPMPVIYDYINKHCRMLSLHEDGILKVLGGITTLEEVYRVSI
ncbi:MAG: GspE/PulE family protein [Candidatus Peregrinibacteria bacterium]